MRRPEFRGLTCFSNLSYTNSVFVRPISVFVTTHPVFVHMKTGLVLQILGLSFIRVIKQKEKHGFLKLCRNNRVYVGIFSDICRLKHDPKGTIA